MVFPMLRCYQIVHGVFVSNINVLLAPGFRSRSSEFGVKVSVLNVLYNWTFIMNVTLISTFFELLLLTFLNLFLSFFYLYDIFILIWTLFFEIRWTHNLDLFIFNQPSFCLNFFQDSKKRNFKPKTNKYSLDNFIEFLYIILKMNICFQWTLFLIEKKKQLNFFLHCIIDTVKILYKLYLQYD